VINRWIPARDYSQEGTNMGKKFSLMLAAVAILAFAIPSMANATVATIEGSPAPKNTSITGTGSDIILQSNLLGTITCSTLNLKGEITLNDGTTVEGKGKNVEPTQAGCKNGEKAVTVTSVELENLKSTTTGSATVSFVAKVDIASLECTFTGTNVPGTFTSGSNVLSFSEATATGIKGAPAACGTSKLKGNFALESGSTALILD
jgi:hypothetical protein